MNLTRSQRRQISDRPQEGQLSRLRDQINRLFDFDWSLAPSSMTQWAPAVDVSDNKDNVVVKAEVPGMRKEDLDVSVEGSNLVISGERREEKEEGKGTNNFRSERYFGQFYRSVPLPASVDAEKVNAKYQDGVLTVTLAKTGESKRKKIDVQAS